MSKVQIDTHRPYFKEQFLYVVGQLEKDEILRRVEERKHKELIKRNKGRFSKCRNYFVEYTFATEVHGVRYLSEKRSLCEKLFWAAVVVTSVIVCILYIMIVLLQFEDTRIIITGSADIPVYEIRFPAVTICPEVFIQGFINSEHEQILSQFRYLLCTIKSKNMENGSKFLKDAEFFNAIKQIKKPVDEFFFNCELFGEQRNCSDLFTPTLTDRGVCYTFNMITRKEIFEDKVNYPLDFYESKPTRDWKGNYKENSGLHSYPKIAYKYGAADSLRVVLKSSKYLNDRSCRPLSKQYAVHLHNPDSMPRPLKHVFLVSQNKFVSVAIDLRLDLTEDRVLKLPYLKRGCYSSKEKDLYYFKKYHKQNCRLECLSNVTLKKCNCVQFYMPRYNGTPICGAKNFVCAVEAEEDMIQQEYEYRKKVKHAKEQCDCAPLCEEINYTTEQTSESRWHWQDYYENQWGQENEEQRNRLNFTTDELSLLSIYMKYPFFLCNKRRMWWELTKLISAVGGYFSLFNGMSIVSVVELIYFLTGRIFSNKFYHGKWWGRH